MTALSESNQQLRRNVESIVSELENGEQSAYDYLEDVLDIEYTVSSRGDYLGARILVGFGGPNLWVDTRFNRVEGYWWSDSYSLGFDDNIGLDDVCAELYESLANHG